jgi:hypothetical protein
MFLRVDISNLVPAVFSDIVAILTAPAVIHKKGLKTCSYLVVKKPGFITSYLQKQSDISGIIITNTPL